MAQKRVDLVNIFQSVTQTLAQNQQLLDRDDEYNHNHGSNMVETFQTITNLLQQKKGKSDGVALAHAAEKLAKNTTSGSGKLYAQGLTQAAAKFKGKKVDSKGALDLLQTLISGGQPAPQATQPGAEDMLGSLMGQFMGGTQPQASVSSQAGGDMLGSLLGQMTGAAQPPDAGPAQAGGDMLSALLGGVTSNQPTSENSAAGGFDLRDLINAGMSYMQAKQQGGNTTQALMQAFMAASGMGSAAHRTESTSLVINSFLQALAASGKEQ
jgi:DAK2 domain